MITYTDTSLGRLIAVASGDEDYPGVTIFLERGNRAVQLATLEEVENELALRAYPNGEDDEPSLNVTFENLDYALKQWGYERSNGGKK